MTWLNVAVVAIFLLSALWGVARGMIREFFAVVGWVGGVYVAWRWGKSLVAPYLVGHLPAEWVVPVADFSLFFLILAGATVLSFLLRGMLYRVGFSIPDRLVGGLFGLLRAAAIVALVILLAQSFQVNDAAWWRQSWLGQTRIEDLAQTVTAPAVSYWELHTRGKNVAPVVSSR
ncbi:CvpA family protein [Acidithiobacillus sp. IBUN Pt1247-S3]|uniref:CvpA family protein n=1 Tax=Acidithiobacillus sp. IBUN Pt1247-S3 TaxID=3166642 RepID=UPI0034E4D9E4